MSVTTSTSELVSLEEIQAYAPEQEPGVIRTVSGRAHDERAARLRAQGRLLNAIPPSVLGLLLLVGWYALGASGKVNVLILPAPADVLSSLLNGLGSGMYLSNTLVTVQESVLGFLLALAVALPLGYGVAKSRLLASTIQPYLAAGQAIPAIVIAPVLVLWLGYGWLPNMLVCALVVLFPMVINTILGIQTIDPQFTDAARVEGASGWSLLSYIEFPLALPSILAAIRSGFTLSIVGALVAEFVAGGDQGLGALILIAKNQYNTPFMYATLVVLAALAALYYGSTWLLVKLAAAIY
jgi:NitT/TauT family transport system permease protein